MALKICFYTAIEGELGSLSRAARRVQEDYGRLVEVAASSKRGEGGRTAGEIAQLAGGADLIIVHLMGGPDSLPGLQDLVELARKKNIPLAVLPSMGDDNQQLLSLSNMMPQDYHRLRLYVAYGGEDNLKNLLLWAAGRYGGIEVAAAEPRPLPWEGFYHPDCPAPEAAALYLQEKLKESRPVVGILFYQSAWVAGNTVFIDELVRQIEKQGGIALPVFLYATRNDELGSRGLAWVLENYFSRDGRPVVDVVVNTLMFSQTMATPTFSRVEEKGLYQRLGVPLIKAIVSLTPFDEWQKSPQGLGPLDVVMSVALPEFDGDLISVPIATREETGEDPSTGAVLSQYVPIPERVSKVASLALRWARLRHKPNQEKRVAIILHNYPPRNDRIGCAFGLDTPASVHRLLVAMQAAGYRVEDLPPDGAALMERVLSGLTNERGWLDPRELDRRAAARVDGDTYRAWFEAFPPQAREHLTCNWGEPPGEVFNYQGQLLVPGILLGNVFVGIQPPRGFLEDPATIYHSPDLAPPHHYLAYYRWLRDVFQADMVFHIGKHGSLEWLPGKGVGLSGACFPDLAINDLPHLYPYIINNPGEGTQAKRRTHAGIIAHLPPVMTRADTYDELAGIEVLVKEYHMAKTLDETKLPALRELIWEKTAASQLDRDLGLEKEEAEKDWEGFLERLHSYLYEVKDTLIRDGLHILGQAPREEALVEMLLALTRLPNNDLPSLRERLALVKGYNYDQLLAEPGFFDPVQGRTNAEIMDEIEQLSRDFIQALAASGFSEEAIPVVAGEILGCRDEEIIRLGKYITGNLVPALEATVEEIGNSIKALAGGFIPPGPSGAPTRGMADILPTGHNFYSIDPQAIPTRAAWEVGKKLTGALLERYQQEKGDYPENVGMVIWATTNMRTGGEDIAQALYLLGVRPVWEEKSGRVKGLAVIPLEELGRPRVDVTIRASGMFRDAFLNVIHLLDRAVEMVAGLDEPETMNFVAAHVKAEVTARIAAGVEEEQAREEARWRIFSDRPGTYGAGVSNLITAKNWQDAKDLGEVYVTWGGYAYSRRTYGREAQDTFRRRLATVAATVKNEDSREVDMFDSDDFYSYHGGMVAAVKAIKGELPLSFSGDSSDPRRVRVRTLEEETQHIFRARVLNPRWIESMKRHGYKGAGDLAALVEHSFGWDATAEVLEDWLYEALAQKYALDPGMQEWFKEVNPWALQTITAQLLEAIERGMWQARPETAAALKELYLDIEGELEARTE
ncbi:cobaltochelatase subunit CobN [Neomoorella mulderi]|uniref:Aerobic cobaltochelatase subunit CobN n=1 Tax=Moorella mulderi DSM 14980 TaxID=1122241 RepID=A0A151AZ60_9FIRM|nr:cobaltochelatase subunit CobN [Moorella mulderi]KYH32921.1 aerobic cobaltochelatase subunit CobN [Moorella mulderi DSM 14980]